MIFCVILEFGLNAHILLQKNKNSNVKEYAAYVDKQSQLTKQLREYADSKEKAVIKKDHLLRMMDIDSSLDFTDDIKELDIEIQKANNHINDINATYNKINITAEKDGVVKSIDQSVQDGFLVVGRNMITVSDDAGYYVMDLSDDLDTSTSGDAKLSPGASIQEKPSGLIPLTNRSLPKGLTSAAS